ncbi:mercury(II) reductase [Georgenia sp. AZ-5]|uniref:mercury(II) reductase n=1 Tax=Georgenia sp. AZ-5 TaxID=3367526 RepID=UPI00375449C8
MHPDPHEISEYDLAVIGSGGAAFAAAIRAASLGRRVVMVERGTVGGTCVNTGCVPSKALLAAAEARHVAVDAARFPGIAATGGPVDMPALIGGKDALVDSMRSEKYVDLINQYGWELRRGDAAFAGTPEAPVLQVTSADGNSEALRAEHYLVATGSAPSAPPMEGLAAAGYLTSTTAMELDQVPESLLVIGGGYVGLEQAQLFARLGTSVTVVEALDRLASSEEPEVSAVLGDVFRDEGIGVGVDTTVTAVRRDEGGYTLIAARTGSVFRLQAEQLLVATGRRPVTGGLGLESVGVSTGQRGEIVVDEHLRTTNPRIWAAGDVTGDPQFVYVAAAHGSLVADNALAGAARTLDYRELPRATFTRPAIAAAGLTEAQAAAQGLACDCRVLPLEHVPRAVVNRDTRGLVKLVAERDTGRLLGAHVIADGAGEVIASAVYALANTMTVQQIAEMWSPYLTMAEGLKLAALTYTRDVAKLSCCAA